MKNNYLVMLGFIFSLLSSKNNANAASNYSYTLIKKNFIGSNQVFGEDTRGNNKPQYGEKKIHNNFYLNFNHCYTRFYIAFGNYFLWVDNFTNTYPNLSLHKHCNHKTIKKYNFSKDSIIILSAPDGALGLGHAAILIGNEKDGWLLYSKNGGASGMFGRTKDPQKGYQVGTLAEFQTNGDPSKNEYVEGYLLSCGYETDAQMAEAAVAQVSKYYLILGASCIDVATDALKAGCFRGGEKTEECFVEGAPILVEWTTPMPNSSYQNIKNNNYGGKVIPLKMNNSGKSTKFR